MVIFGYKLAYELSRTCYAILYPQWPQTNRNELLHIFNAKGRQNAKSQHFEFISKNVIDFIEIE